MERNNLKNNEPFVVNYVNFNKTRLVDHNDNYYKEIGIGEAKQIAKEVNLDLVCFNIPDNTDLALCKIVDYGKWKYSNEKQKKKQDKEHKKQLKEIRLSPVIDDHDVEYKIKQAIGFIDSGLDVIFRMKLKGRQKAFLKEAEQRMNEIIELCKGHGEIVSVKKSSNQILVRVSKKQKEEK
jgi:translation initiation factor IF-3